MDKMDEKLADQSEMIDDMKIRYRVFGRGPSTLLLLHGAVGECNSELSSGSITLVLKFCKVQLTNSYKQIDRKLPGLLPSDEPKEWPEPRGVHHRGA